MPSRKLVAWASPLILLAGIPAACPPGLAADMDHPDQGQERGAGGARALAGPLDVMVRAATGSEWAGSRRALTPSGLVQAAALLGEEVRARSLLGPLREAHSLVWSLAGGQGTQIACHVIRFQEPTAARRYWDFTQELHRKQDELWNAPGQPAQVLESRSSFIAAPFAGGQAVRVDKRMKLPRQAEPGAVTVFLVQQGALHIELTWFGLAADDAWTWRAVRYIVEAVRQSGAGED
jgi:hypothetical protein